MNQVAKKKAVRTLRLVSYFLRKYPGYTFKSMMNEYAIRIYALINQSLILDARSRQEDILIASAPFAKKSDQRTIKNMYQRMGEDFVEKFLLDKDSGHEAGMSKLKRLFGGK